MALTLTPVPGASARGIGNKVMRVYDVTVTASAAVVTPRAVGLSKIECAAVACTTAPTTFLYDFAAGTIGVGTGRVAFIGY